MKIATWNVNSVRARLENLQLWLNKDRPDVVLLQELKCQSEAFPFSFFEDFGYSCQILGQKTYNGVAILALDSIEDVVVGLPTFPEDSHARYIEAVIGGHLRVASLYLPNGGDTVGGPSYNYKLDFLDRFNQHLAEISRYDESILIGGDFNIAPDDHDVYNAKLWQGRVCCTDQERIKFKELKSNGFADVMEQFCQQGRIEQYCVLDPNNSHENDKSVSQADPEHPKRPFTWWDYRSPASVSQDRGLRLDLFLANLSAIGRIQNIYVDKWIRSAQRPSDHAPLILELEN